MIAGGSASLGLPRARRIKHGRDFALARSQGRRILQGCLVLNWVPRLGEAGSRLGVITARKLGNAAVRNRARRLLRESFRRHQHQLQPETDIVLVARQSILGMGFAEVEADFLTALRKARLLRSAPGSPPAPGPGAMDREGAGK